MEKFSLNCFDRDALLKRKAEVQAEINSYPSPIAGCDQQFNHLLEMRAEIRKQLQKVEQSLKKPCVDE